MIGALALKTLRAEVGSPVTAFSDIVIQDGTSFAVNESLRAILPGRFRTNDPAAIELHATFSGLQDDVLAVSLARDKEVERQFLPTPSELKGKLLLADRGYPSIDDFKALDDAGASFVMRLSRGFDPEFGPTTARAASGTRCATALDSQRSSRRHGLGEPVRRGPQKGAAGARSRS